MAGKNDDVSNTAKPAKGTTEKKKRKRPSKKVPTTVLQANSSGFMHLVQKLTGSAEELAAAQSSNPSPYSSSSKHATQPSSNGHTTNVIDDIPNSGYSYSTAPFSSAPVYTQDVGMPSFQDHYQQYHESGPASNYGYSGYGSYGAGSGGYVAGGSGSARSTYGEEDDSYGNYSGSTRGAPDLSDRYNSSPSSSRGMEQNDVSPFSWRDPAVNRNTSSDYYWY